MFTWLSGMFQRKKKSVPAPEAISARSFQASRYRSMSAPESKTDSGDIGTSMLVGYATNNALLGGIVGGSLIGGVIGDIARDGGIGSSYSPSDCGSSSDSGSDSYSSCDSGSYSSD